MRVVGLLNGDEGREAFAVELPHGQDPQRLVWEQGYRLTAPVSASRDPGGELVLRVRIARPRGPAPVLPAARTDTGLVLSPGEVPVVRQRVAAYALVHSQRGMLATQFSARTAVAGRWGLPGGGIDAGEEPAAAVRREVYEESAQDVVVHDLFAVQSSHWIGRAPSGVIEDFQAIRLAYRASCAEPTDPRVLDVGGTTAAVRWVPQDAIPSLTWTIGWRRLLQEWRQEPAR